MILIQVKEKASTISTKWTDQEIIDKLIELGFYSQLNLI